MAIGVSRDGGEARLTVTDAGAGLRAADAEAAFERFWRGPDSRARPGTGLGLAIVRAVAAAHGGRAEVEGATLRDRAACAARRDRDRQRRIRDRV